MLSVDVDRRSPHGAYIPEHYCELGEVIDLPEIETSLPLSDIYSGISFVEKD